MVFENQSLIINSNFNDGFELGLAKCEEIEKNFKISCDTS